MCWHKWSRWSDYKKGSVSVRSPDLSKHYEEEAYYQDRECAKCGLKQIKKIEVVS